MHVAATKIVYMQKEKKNVQLIPTSLHGQIKNPNVNIKALKERNRERIFLWT